MPLKGISHPLSFRLEPFSPNIGLPCESPARGEFPLRFSGQALVGPSRISLRVSEGNLDDGVTFLSLNGAVRTAGVAPVRPPHVAPPLEVIVQGDSMIWRGKDHSSGIEIFGWRARKLRLGGSFLRDGNVASSFDEFGELRIGDIGLI